MQLNSKAKTVLACLGLGFVLTFIGIRATNAWFEGRAQLRERIEIHVQSELRAYQVHVNECERVGRSKGWTCEVEVQQTPDVGSSRGLVFVPDEKLR
jgi:hypothetical protein